MEDEFLDATEGDDFIGVQTYSRDRDRTERHGRARGRRADAAHGLRVLARRRSRRRCGGRGRYTGGPRRCSSPRTASAPTTTRSASSTSPRALEGVLRALADGIDVRGLHVLEPARQLRVGVRLPAQVRAGRRRPRRRSPARRSRRPRWLGEIAKANALSSGSEPRRILYISVEYPSRLQGRVAMRRHRHADGGAAQAGPGTARCRSCVSRVTQLLIVAAERAGWSGVAANAVAVTVAAVPGYLAEPSVGLGPRRPPRPHPRGAAVLGLRVRGPRPVDRVRRSGRHRHPVALCGQRRQHRCVRQAVGLRFVVLDQGALRVYVGSPG